MRHLTRHPRSNSLVAINMDRVALVNPATVAALSESSPLQRHAPKAL